MLKMGLIINPIAGIGGRVGLRGSDGESTQTEALRRGAVPLASERARAALSVLQGSRNSLEIFTAQGEMGETLARSMGFQTHCVYEWSEPSSAEDTIKAAKSMVGKVDLLLFAGGDGTARNIADALGEDLAVLGIPAGCKIHSGVFGITPQAVGEVVKEILEHRLVSFKSAEVVDLDEELFRKNQVKVKHYGELMIPAAHEYVQATKAAGVEQEALVIEDIAAEVLDSLDAEVFIVGSGSTCAAVMGALDLPNSLLGIDVVVDGQLEIADASEAQLLKFLETNKKPLKLLVTAIGKQGHVFGRGNQQLSPAVLRKIGRENIQLIATKTKINQLANKPFIADTGDAELDQQLSGVYPVITGYRDRVLYPLR